MTEVRRRALRQPRSLTHAQLEGLNVTIATHPVPVQAWVIWDDGSEDLLDVRATAWTRRAVQIQWGVPPHTYDSWVWSGAVERSEPR